MFELFIEVQRYNAFCVNFWIKEILELFGRDIILALRVKKAHTISHLSECVSTILG